ncbi:hypothetical protein MIR68_011130 [Amoeboaphelidium protococcarum]|nr:hypothetical protein MIR68_011130 [Amoeboaphelidium protococcarum]
MVSFVKFVAHYAAVAILVLSGVVYGFALTPQLLQEEGVYYNGGGNSDNILPQYEDAFFFPEVSNQGHNKWAAFLVILPGAQVNPACYSSLIAEIQSKSEIPLYVGLPHLHFDLAFLRGNVEAAIERVYNHLVQHGMPIDARFALAGHSLGAVAAQQYTADAYGILVQSDSDDPNEVHVSRRRQLIKPWVNIFLGSSLLRKYKDVKYPVPWMQVSGSLDGLHRVTRVAQSVYHYVLNNRDGVSSVVTDNPVVIVDGMTHMQVSGCPVPWYPAQKDLRASISGAEALDQVSMVAATFIDYHLNEDRTNWTVLRDAVERTKQFMAPLLEAMRLEAHVHLKKRCNSDKPSPHCPFYPAWPEQKEPRQFSNDTDCWCGTPWANVAIKQMVDADNVVEVVNADAIHDVRDTNPYHHAHIWNNCSDHVRKGQFIVQEVDMGENLAVEKCKLNVTTVSESMYDKYDSLDTGLAHGTAEEIRVKMKSRQLYRRHTTNPFADYDEDDMDVCMEINQLAYKYALEHSDPKVVKRFMKFGQKMHFLPDYHFPIAIGPLWINSRLKYKEMDLVNEDGKLEKVLSIKSISMKTDLDSWINKLHPDSAGQHYCKLLSPARAMEWIYVDGLRHKLGYSVKQGDN